MIGNRPGRELRMMLLAALALLQLVFLTGCRAPLRLPLGHNSPGGAAGPAISDLQDPGPRVLVIAPHPDDESIAAAGVIQRAVKDGKGVRVVIVTDGDRFIRAAQLLTGKEKVTPGDLALLGRVRRQESLRALGLLGLNDSQVLFLGYHDRSLTGLWSEFRSHKEGSPGARLAGDLGGIVGDWQPTDIYYPSEEDEHPDHNATCLFVRAALEAGGFSGREHQYLVHFDGDRWPASSLIAPRAKLTPPVRLLTGGHAWEQFSLQPREIAVKARAIGQYATQLRAMGGRYLTYARGNELFLRP